MTDTAAPASPASSSEPAIPGRSGPRFGSGVRRAGWVAIVVAALALLMVAGIDRGGAETDTERIQRLNESFACPVCKGESVADSNAAAAATIREFIAQEVTAGSTDTEIRDKLVAGYTTKVLRNPPADGVATLIWMLPVVLVAGGAAGVTLMLGRLRPGATSVSDADRELVRQARLASSGPDALPDEGL